jgi:predicted acyl esterase
MAQWFIAETKPPHLCAIAPWNGISDVYRQNMMFGGIPDMGFLAGVFAHLAGPGRVERPDAMAEAHPLMDAYWQDKVGEAGVHHRSDLCRHRRRHRSAPDGHI